MLRRQIKAIGSVQGVFFRYSAKVQANRLELSGWCRNESDGSVVLEIQGDAKDIENFIDWARKGPPLAKVAGIEIKEIDLQNDNQEFEIR